MDKKTQMWLGVAAVGVAAYLIWKQSQKEKVFANLVSKKSTLDTSQCAGPVEILTNDPTANPMRCHYACENRDGDIINLGGNPPCPSASL